MATSTYRAHRVFGSDQIELKENQKLVHFIRHAQGYHNIDGEADPVKGYLKEENEDASLSQLGVMQCYNLYNELKGNEVIIQANAVLTSPMRRTCQTATYSFPLLMNKIPWIALESLRETTGLHPCDRRRPRDELQLYYPHINFNQINDNMDPLYDKYELREPFADVELRCLRFMTYLANCSDKNIIVVSHSSYLYTLFTSVIKVMNDSNEYFEGFKNCEIRSFVIDVRP